MTINFKSAASRVTAIALNLYSTVFKVFLYLIPSFMIIDCRDQSHNQDPDLNFAVIKSSHPVLAAAVGVNLVNRVRCNFWLQFLKLDPQAFI